MQKNYLVRPLNIPLLFTSIGLFLPLLLIACGSGGANRSVMAMSTDDPVTIVLKPHVFALNAKVLPTLKLHGDVCKVSVQVGAGSRASVQATIRHYRANKMPTINYTQNRDRSALAIEEKLPPFHSDTNANSDSVEFTITVPRHIDLLLNTKVGSLYVNNVIGQMALATNTGSITASQVQVSRQTSFITNVGHITFDGALAPTGTYRIQARVGSIDATIQGHPSLRVDAQTSIGNIDNAFPSVEADGNSAQGSIGSPPYGRLSVSTRIGSISLQQA